MRYFIIPLLASLLAVSCMTKSREAVKAPEYRVLTLDTTTMVIYNEYPAMIVSDAIIDVKPKITGYVVGKYIKSGDIVKKGQLLFKIDDTEYRQQLNAAKAALEGAKAELSKAELEVHKLTPLVEKGIISPYELEVAKSNLSPAQAAVAQAEATYKIAQLNLGYTEIHAPREGIIGFTHISVGELATPNNNVVEIAIDGLSDACFSFDEKKLTAAARKQYQKSKSAPIANLELELPDGSIYPHKGILKHATGRVDPTTGSLILYGQFENKNYELLDGTSGIIRIPIEYKGCITVPQNATYELQDRTMVFVMASDSTVTRKSLKIEGTSNDCYIVNNLERGTIIVTEGVDRLRDGMKITPKVQ